MNEDKDIYEKIKDDFYEKKEIIKKKTTKALMIGAGFLGFFIGFKMGAQRIIIQGR